MLTLEDLEFWGLSNWLYDNSRQSGVIFKEYLRLPGSILVL